MKKCTFSKLFLLVLLSVSGVAQASESYTYFALEGREYSLDNNDTMHKAFLHSPVISALERLGVEKGDGTRPNPFVLEDVSYENFDAFIRLLDEELYLEDFDFQGWVALAQLVDYFGLIGQEDFDKLMLGLGKRLKANQEGVFLLSEGMQNIANRIIEYYREHNPIDTEKILFFSKKHSFNDYFNLLSERGIVNFVKERLLIKGHD